MRRLALLLVVALGFGVVLVACSSSHPALHRKTGFVFIPGKQVPPRSTSTTASPTTTTPPTVTTTTPPTTPTTGAVSQGPLYGMPLLAHVPFTMDHIHVRGNTGMTSSGKMIILVLSRLSYAQAKSAWTAVCAYFHDPCNEYQPVFRGGGEIG